MNIKTKLFISLGSLTLALILVGGLSVYSISKLNSQNQIFISTKNASAKMLSARLRSS